MAQASTPRFLFPGFTGQCLENRSVVTQKQPPVGAVAQEGPAPSTDEAKVKASEGHLGSGSKALQEVEEEEAPCA